LYSKSFKTKKSNTKYFVLKYNKRANGTGNYYFSPHNKLNLKINNLSDFSPNFLYWFGSPDFSSLELFLELGLGLVLQPPDVLHRHAVPLVSPTEDLKRHKTFLKNPLWAFVQCFITDYCS